MGGVDKRRWKVVLVGVEDSLHIVLVETEERRQGFGITDGRGTDRVDHSEEHLGCVRRAVDVDDRGFRRSVRWLGNEEHISEY